ncbi:hypothetical protein Q5Y75_13950 [Ruegeria sp. 2205SS24-7]|uniref:hypothetical protein n=1 Tax=Ruegeria discodermiae TaxID=3064389 RepID=UPI0027412699|nr:hypothetical protein [Ruegeria sp. 2205SS24-7]MDP5218330.1 hypothetical protein [Ruegeria sp. 2205SS24-7]
MTMSKVFLTGTLLGLALAVSAQADEIGEANLAALDKNSDGVVSGPEYQDFSNFAFDQMDTNKNGSLSAAEMDAAGAGDHMSSTDANGDGKVSKTELSEQMAEDFNAADKDGDGRLN